MNNFRADLHCHTTFSDGTLSPTRILQLASSIGLSGLSITDHDTIEGYEEAFTASRNTNIPLLTGVEFSSVLKNHSVHILCYAFSIKDPHILQLCKRHILRRKERNEKILALLKQHKMPITFEDLQSVHSDLSSETTFTVGRPHIALAMVKKGYVKTPQEAFQKYIGEGKKCYYSGNAITVEETLEIIHKANGLAVIAHPHLINDRKILNNLLEKNFDGIEAYYAIFHSEDEAPWIEIARKKGWIITGGSDFHGELKPNIPLGSSWVNKETFDQLYRHYQANEALPLSNQ